MWPDSAKCRRRESCAASPCTPVPRTAARRGVGSMSPVTQPRNPGPVGARLLRSLVSVEWDGSRPFSQGFQDPMSEAERPDPALYSDGAMQALLELRCTLPEHFYAYKRTYAERGTYFRSHIRFVTQRWTMTVPAHLPTYPGDESVTTSVNRSCSLVGRGWGDHIWPDLEYPRGSAGCCAPSLAVGESPLASLGLSRCPARWAWVRRRQRQVTSLSPMLGGRSALPAWAAGMTSAGVAVDRSPPPCCLGHSAMGPASDPQSSPTPTCP